MSLPRFLVTAAIVLAAAVPAFGQALPDGRAIVANPTVGPARFIGRVAYLDPRTKEHPGLINGGTGALIGPRHVLTAAHVIFNPSFPAGFDGEEGMAPNAITFSPGQSDDKTKPVEAKVVGIYMQRAYKSAKRKVDQVKGNPLLREVGLGTFSPDQILDMEYVRMDYDIAVLLLDQDLGRKLGGHLTIAALSDADIASLNGAGGFQANGYDSDQTSFKQVNRTGKISPYRDELLVSNLIKEGTAKVQVNIYSAPWKIVGGASGGPVWAERGGVPTVIGMLNSDDKGKSQGLLLTEFYVKWIEAFIKDNP